MPSAIPAESKVPSEEFATQCRGQMIPLDKWISYFSVVPLNEGELQRLVYDPASAIPSKMAEIIPKLRIVLVPFLEKPPRSNGSGSKGPIISFQLPAKTKRMVAGNLETNGETYIFLSIHDEDVADAHYILYQQLAELVATRAGGAEVEAFYELLRAEIGGNVHGEIDERAWQLKDELLRKQKDPCRKTKLLAAYRRQALQDTLTLYLHGLCCDIDVDAGPRQLASGHIRKRLMVLKGFLPPPNGVALFPEELPPPK